MGFVNNSGQAASLMIYGITPPAGVSRTPALAEARPLWNGLRAPGFDLGIERRGNGGQFVGSLGGEDSFLLAQRQRANRYDESLD